MLCDQRVWDDKGTGHVACVPSPEHQGATFIVVRLEHSGEFQLSNFENIIFSFFSLVMFTGIQQIQLHMIIILTL